MQHLWLNLISRRKWAYNRQFHKVYIFSNSLHTIKKKLKLPDEQLIHGFSAESLEQVLEAEAQEENELEEDEDPTTAILEEIGRHVLTDAVVRVIYELPSEQADTVDLKAVNQALDNAFLVASIAPKPRVQVHIRRADISEDMRLKDTLHAYIQNRPDLEALEEDLQACASRLERELLRGCG